MKRYPIDVGSMLFTMVEPRPGHEVEYNRWYERDHFYAGCLIGPGCYSGGRYVATRALKDLRVPQGESPMTPSAQTGSYLALYWLLSGMHDEWNRWAVDQVNALHQAGRMFPERDHIHTLLYRYAFDVERDDDSVSLALALDHPFAGIGVTVADCAEGTDRTALIDWYREMLASVLLDSSVAVVGGFTPLPLLVDAPGDVPRHEKVDNRLLLLWFFDDDVTDDWAEHVAGHANALRESGAGSLVWAAPFIPTIPGTDIYTDQLR